MKTSTTQRQKSPIPATSIPSGANTEAFIGDAFDDIALVIGGVAAIHHLDDDIVWAGMKRLDGIGRSLIIKLSGISQSTIGPGSFTPPRVHPAVEAFLARNRATEREGVRRCQ